MPARLRHLLALSLVLVVAAGCATGRERARSAREGLQSAHDRLEGARQAAEAAHASLELLVSASGTDLVPLYDDFVHAVDALRGDAAAVQRLPGQLESRGDAYFRRWEAELAEIRDGEVRAASASRRAEALTTYGRAVDALSQTSSMFDGLLALLRDVRLALGNDLTRPGIQAVRDVSDRVGRETASVVAQLESLMGEVDGIAAELSTSVPAE